MLIGDLPRADSEEGDWMDENKFVPKGAVAFFIGLIAVFAALWFALYHFMLKQV